jgi:hypothetical protein
MIQKKNKTETKGQRALLKEIKYLTLCSLVSLFFFYVHFFARLQIIKGNEEKKESEVKSQIFYDSFFPFIPFIGRRAANNFKIFTRQRQTCFPPFGVLLACG